MYTLILLGLALPLALLLARQFLQACCVSDNKHALKKQTWSDSDNYGSNKHAERLRYTHAQTQITTEDNNVRAKGCFYRYLE